MSEKGYIKLNRKFFDNLLWKEPRVYSRAEAWLDLIQSARFDSSSVILSGRVIEVQRGEIVASIRFLEDRWKWSNTKVENYLKLLRKMGMITTKNDTGITVLSLCNYSLYNDIIDSENDTGATPKRHRSDTKTTNIIKEKKVNKGKDIIPPLPPISLNQNLGDEEKEKSSAKKEREFVEKVIAYFNEQCKNLKPVQVMTVKRTASILARCREHGEEKIILMIQNASKSTFLSGQNDRGWTATFDWLFKPENFVKTFEGNFNTKQNGKGKSTSNIDQEELSRATAEGIARACTKQEWER